LPCIDFQQSHHSVDVAVVQGTFPVNNGGVCRKSVLRYYPVNGAACVEAAPTKKTINTERVLMGFVFPFSWKGLWKYFFVVPVKG